MKRIFQWLIISIFLVMAGAGGFLYYDHYWRWRGCFNEFGRCYDPESDFVYLEQAGLIWGSFTIVFLIIAITAMARRRR